MYAYAFAVSYLFSGSPVETYSELAPILSWHCCYFVWFIFMNVYICSFLLYILLCNRTPWKNSLPEWFTCINILEMNLKKKPTSSTLDLVSMYSNPRVQSEITIESVVWFLTKSTNQKDIMESCVDLEDLPSVDVHMPVKLWGRPSCGYIIRLMVCSL